MYLIQFGVKYYRKHTPTHTQAYTHMHAHPEKAGFTD